MGLLNFEELSKIQLELSHLYLLQKKEKKKQKYAEFMKRRAESEIIKKNICGR